MRTFTKESVVDGWSAWERFRKTTPTAMLHLGPLAEPVEVRTQSGALTLDIGWIGYIAIDADGYPYPIELSVHEQTYESVPEGLDIPVITDRMAAESLAQATVLQAGDRILLVLTDRVEWTPEMAMNTKGWVKQLLPGFTIEVVAGVHQVLVQRDGPQPQLPADMPDDRLVLVIARDREQAHGLLDGIVTRHGGGIGEFAGKLEARSLGVRYVYARSVDAVRGYEFHETWLMPGANERRDYNALHDLAVVVTRLGPHPEVKNVTDTGEEIE